MRSTGSEARISRGRVATAFLAVALLLLPFADLDLAGHDPWNALGRMAAGFLSPDFGAIEDIGRALALTLAFAIAGVALGGAAGLALAPFYGMGAVRGLCVFVRSVHEMLWALMLMQVAGVGAATGVIAIALPYAGIFAKVFAEYLEEADQRPTRALAPGVDALSRFLWARAPLALGPMASYALYRLECGLRSSAVLGFIGLPTLGFQLDSFFKQGDYGAAGAIIALYVLLIATIRVWMRPRLVLPWLLGALAVLASLSAPPVGEGALWRFLTQDLVPAPLRRGDVADPATWAAFGDWLAALAWTQILPGLVATLIVAQIALALTGLLAFALAPLSAPPVAGRVGAALGRLLLVVLRSFPEYMLAYLFLQAFGPSMLPAILALGLHNGAIIAHLIGRQACETAASLRPDAPRGASLWGWELAPRLYGSFLALCLYRWEIIVRESAIVGMLGVATLGFFVDSAVAELRLDRAAVIILAAALMTAAIDALSRRIRARLGAAALRTEAEARAAARERPA